MKESLLTDKLDNAIDNLLSEFAIIALEAVLLESSSYFECQLISDIAIATGNQVEGIRYQMWAEVNQEYLVDLVIVLDNRHLVILERHL